MRPRGYEHARVCDIEPEALAKIRALKQTKRWPLVLWGSVGTGKTCAAACLYGGFKIRPMWHRADDLLMSMAFGRSNGVSIDAYNEHKELVRKKVTYDKFIEMVQRTSCLFLDDLGTRKPSEGMFTELFALLEHRAGKALCITTNLSGRELTATYDNRIVDRLRIGTPIEFAGVSRRTVNV